MRSSIAGLVLLCVLAPASAATPDVGGLIEKIIRVDKHGAGHREAVAAVRELQQADGGQLIEILRGMDGAGPLAANWLRGAFETVAAREQRETGKLPADALERFVMDLRHGDHSRRLAYEWLVRIDDKTPDRLLPTMLDDPSLELRFDAIAQALAAIEARQKDDASRDAVVADFRRVLGHARDQDQIKNIAERLKGLDAKVDLPTHFGFVMQWQVIGPFDNADGKGFAAVYPPEKKVDLAAHEEGSWGTVRWQAHATADRYGAVDLNKALGVHKNAVAYAASEFTVDEARPVELRMGCINACKAWLNGELVIEREVYHTAMDIDQYVGKGRLKRGKNVILVKICQNDQKEEWAQNWAFQLRVCDSRGTAVLARERLAAVDDRTPDEISPSETKIRRLGDKETRRRE
jgi:hypothetical protein